MAPSGCERASHHGGAANGAARQSAATTASRATAPAPTRPRRWGIRAAIALALTGSVALAGAWIARELLPADGAVTAGLIVDGVAAERGEETAALVRQRVERRLAQTVMVKHGDDTVLTASLAELGAVIDLEAVAQRVAAVARHGSWWQRLDDALEARRGHLSVSLPVVVPVETLAAKLETFKAARDRTPRAARWDFDSDGVVAHRAGGAVDVYQAVRAVELAARRGQPHIELPTRVLEPRATTAVVEAIDRAAVVSTYETRFAFLGGQAGRAQNIRRAAEAVSGMVLMPGEVVSFNAVVGPRSIDNGFAKAGEIYKGEMRMGVGGGTCQVASTLYSAAFFGALEVVERSPHSRPSGYVPIGLDATVAYPHVDLKLRNPYPFPILVRATFAPGVLTFDLLGQKSPATVSYDADTVRVKPYKRKIREAHFLAQGKVVRKQKGIRGVTIRKFRRIRYRAGNERLEETTDVYPATNEVYLVAPGTDIDEALPPMAEGVELEEKTRRRVRAKQRTQDEAPQDTGPTYPGEDEGLG